MYSTKPLTPPENAKSSSWPERFMNESPEKYKEMVANVKPVSKHIIDKAEFDKMPANKRNEIVSHPEKYQIQ